MPVRVLVVDDEPMLLELVARLLADFGYEVVAAPSGEKALEIVKGGGVPIDLVLSDALMPGMSGPDLLASVRKIAPRVARVLMSAYCPAELGGRDLDYIQKPFTAGELQRALGQALGRCQRPESPPAEAANPLEVILSSVRKLVTASQRADAELRREMQRVQHAVERGWHLQRQASELCAANAAAWSAHHPRVDRE